MARHSIIRGSTAASTLFAALSFTVVSMTGSAAAQKYSDWTGWRMTDDPLIQWRTRTQDWGKNMSPVCEFEIRVGGEAATNFRYDIIFRPEGEGTNGSHRAGTAYGRTRDRDFSDTIGGCREVSDIRVTRVVRRTGTPGEVTRKIAVPDGQQRTGRRRAESPNTRVSRGADQSIPDVIHFPGPRKPYRGSQLNGVRLDSHSLRSIRSASDRLSKLLLDWRPLRVWAYGRAVTISQRDWDSLARITARADKGILHELAVDAARHADRYPPGTTLHQFWRSMAGFYRYQGGAK